MFSNFKLIILLALVFSELAGLHAQYNTNSNERVSFAQLRTAYSTKKALGNNFLSEAYTLKDGFELDLRYFVWDNIYGGLKFDRFNAQANETELIGPIAKSDISHLYFTAGYAFLPRNSKFGLDAGIGLGWGRYKHTVGPSTEDNLEPFEDTAFATTLGLSANYRADKNFGFYITSTLNKDFMGIDAPTELNGFFKNASTISFNLGIYFTINQ